MCWFFLIRRYPKLPCLSFFVQASGEHVTNHSIYNSLRELKSLALPRVQVAISGCDINGCLKGKGKLSSWKVFEAASDEQLVAFTDLKVPVLRN